MTNATRTWWLGVLLCACAADEGSSRNPGAGSDSVAAGSSGATGSVDGFGNSDNRTGTVQTGGTGTDPAGTTDPVTGLAEGEECAGYDEMAENGAQPTDIIIAVDQSSSMTQEVAFVQTQLNAFSQRIVDAMIDVHVILIVEKPGGPVFENPVCIPPPLAGPNCADNEPLFKHVNQHVDSNNAWEMILETYPQYAHLLRPDAQKHIVIISDDAPNLTGAAFDQMLLALDAQFSGYKHHAIYAFTYPGSFCLPGSDPCCGLADGDGSEYGRHTDATGGINGNLCLQDFESVWSALATQVIENTTLACDWEIPPPPPGETLDPLRVNVHYSGDGLAPQLLGFVDGFSACGAAGGWYYDNAQQPTRIFACPETCATMQELGNARIDIKFGCDRCTTGLDVTCGNGPPPKPPSVD